VARSGWCRGCTESSFDSADYALGVQLTLIQYSPECKSAEVKVHVNGKRVCVVGGRGGGAFAVYEALLLSHTHITVSSKLRVVSHTAAPALLGPASLPEPLEILLLAKLRALCLHSRCINPLIPHRSTRSLYARKEDMKNWSTSVYTALSSDTEPSIVITFESAKYIFNAGENTTRAILQSTRGWRKVKALFLTQLGTQRSSGVSGMLLDSLVVRCRGHYGPLTTVLVPGLLMSVADSSPRAMQIVGPSGLLHFLASMRFYVFRFVGSGVFPHTPHTQFNVLLSEIL